MKTQQQVERALQLVRAEKAREKPPVPLSEGNKAMRLLRTVFNREEPDERYYDWLCSVETVLLWVLDQDAHFDLDLKEFASHEN